MSREQVRGELAKVLGWTRSKTHDWHRRDDHETRQYPHPIPDTLDGIAALWREHAAGWTWRRNECYWIAFSPTASVTEFGPRVASTGDEYLDRASLLLAVLKRKGGANERAD